GQGGGTGDRASRAAAGREEEAEGIREADAQPSSSFLIVPNSAPLPAAALARRAAARARRRAELGAGMLRAGRLDDPAVAAERLFRQRAAGAIGQGFRAVHLVEMRLVDLATNFFR